MSFLDCSKNGFGCQKKIENMQSKLIDYINLEAGQKKIIADYEAQIADHNRYMAAGLPSMDEMIKDGRAKPFTTSDFQRQFKKQYGKTLKQSIQLPNANDVPWIDISATSRYRLPYTIMTEIIKRSKIDRFKYATNASARPFVCVDFSFALWAETNAGPFWDCFISCVWTSVHAINMLWFSDDESLYLLEPQSDSLYPVTTKGDFVRVIT